jgi:hypothetical protein
VPVRCFAVGYGLSVSDSFQGTGPVDGVPYVVFIVLYGKGMQWLSLTYSWSPQAHDIQDMVEFMLAAAVSVY